MLWALLFIYGGGLRKIPCYSFYMWRRLRGLISRHKKEEVVGGRDF